jgi:hypothetical protein
MFAEIFREHQIFINTSRKIGASGCALAAASLNKNYTKCCPLTPGFIFPLTFLSIMMLYTLNMLDLFNILESILSADFLNAQLPAHLEL